MQSVKLNSSGSSRLHPKGEEGLESIVGGGGGEGGQGNANVFFGKVRGNQVPSPGSATELVSTFIIQHIDTLPKYGQKLSMYVGPHDVYPTIDVNFSILTRECKSKMLVDNIFLSNVLNYKTIIALKLA